MPDVIVFDYEQPRQRLMSWFLKDSGIDVDRVTSLDELYAAMTPTTCVVVINSEAPNSRIAALVETIKRPDGLRVIVLHAGKHAADDIPINADICLHDVSDPDFLIDTVVEAIRDRLPDAEPHEAAEQLEGTGA